MLPNAYIIRTSWLYSSFGKNFVKTIARLAIKRDHLDVIVDQVGSPTYARDLGFAIVKMLEAIQGGQADTPGIYHYTNEGVTSWYDIACAVVRQRKLCCEVRPIRTEQYPTHARRPCFSVLDKSKIRSNFDLRIPNWYDSLLLCLQKLNDK
jgi:dTDP-4-dehydrorhamnose reductase